MDKELDFETFRGFIIQENSKNHIDRVADYIGASPERFAVLVEVICENAPKYAQKATWVMEHCCDRFPFLVDPHIDQLLNQTQIDGHQGVRRGILRSLENRPMNEDQTGVALEIAFNFLASAEENVAIKVYSMGMIFNLTNEYPELRQELKLHIESQLPFQSAAFKSKAARVVAALKKIR